MINKAEFYDLLQQFPKITTLIDAAGKADTKLRSYQEVHGFDETNGHLLEDDSVFEDWCTLSDVAEKAKLDLAQAMIEFRKIGHINLLGQIIAKTNVETLS